MDERYAPYTVAHACIEALRGVAPLPKWLAGRSADRIPHEMLERIQRLHLEALREQVARTNTALPRAEKLIAPPGRHADGRFKRGKDKLEKTGCYGKMREIRI